MITSTANPAVKAARKLARRGRPAGDGVLVEGPQVLKAALPHLERLFHTAAGAAANADLLAAAAAAGVLVSEVAEPVFRTLTDTVEPQGVVGIAHLPYATLDEALGDGGLVIVLHSPRDPGNVGTIIRTADAAGATAVILAGAAVDPRNAKAVRASAGSLFHVPVATATWPAVLAACRSHGRAVVGADPRGARLYTDVELGRQPTAFVFGNEAHGLSAAVLADCDTVARVPIVGAAESLNLAATVAVIAYEAARQRAAPQARQGP